ncbi:MAG: polyribonucleotide nucleotidyltransferase [Actinomycetota bacterium]
MEGIIKTEIDGKEIVLETGKWARQADAAVTVRSGDTLVLVTVVASKEPKAGDFLPLVVDVEERMYAAGKIPGSFLRREGRPSEQSILTARLIDRPIRPLFPEGFRNEVQVIATILSADQINPPDVLALLGASAALTISDIPFNGPLGAIRVGRKDGKLLFNPSFQELEESDIDLVLAGTKEEIVMMEGEAREIDEADVMEILKTSMEPLRRLIETEEEFRRQVGVAKREISLLLIDEDLKEKIASFASERINKALKITDAGARHDELTRVRDAVKKEFSVVYEEKGSEIRAFLEEIEKKEVRRMITEKGVRVDGRTPEEIRPISCQVGLLPRAHGSGLFARGQTQTLSVLTVGAVGKEQRLDGLSLEETKRFIHHYNFPPFSTGEIGFMRGPKRREIGHGALVERALAQIIPEEEEFPYTIRLVSEILESNGSSSMASVCSSILALMDGGVSIKTPAAGIAIGLIKAGDKIVLLRDILGIEDFYGDMDCKVAGTRKGITGLQMDLKIGGISFDIISQALEKAKEGRIFILDKMAETIAEPRKALSKFAPRVLILKIPTDKIREVIGPGGKMIRSIIEETGVDIDIEDDGRVFITAKDEQSAEKARQIIEGIIQERPPRKMVRVGEQYLGTVVSIAPFGAFVEIVPGREGLVHISKLARHHVAKVEDVVQVGEKLLVQVIGIDNQDRISLAAADLRAAPPTSAESRKE